MNTCPCCSDILLRHINRGRSYWFCRSCWAEMPSFEEYRACVAVDVPEPVCALSIAKAMPDLAVSSN